MANNTLNSNINSLEYDQIKENLKAFFKSQDDFKDYNFEGSNLSAILNILSYNTHYLGFYVKMLLNESFVDSSQTKQALMSHAKRTGYVVKGFRSARSTVQYEINGVDKSVNTIKIPRGLVNRAVGASQAGTNFVSLDDVVIKPDSKGNFISKEVVLYEGTIDTISYYATKNQEYFITDGKCDVDTITVYVKPSENSNIREVYTHADNIVDIKENSKVFYLTTRSENKYEIVFGGDVYGKQPDTNSVVEISYVSCNGSQGNNIINFEANLSRNATTKPTDINYYTNSVLVKTIDQSSGGLDEESIDALRFGIPNHNRRQKRAVNEQDFKGIVVSEFRDVESVSVWGGEKNVVRDYGKTYMSIKPKYSDRLTETAKKEIRNKIVKKFGVVGTNIVFMNPDFTEISMKISVKVDNTQAVDEDGVIESLITERAFAYNDTTLSKFESNYGDSNFTNYCRKDINYISSIFTTKTISKRLEFINGTGTGYTIDFSNPITSFKSDNFKYGLSECYLYGSMDDGFVYIYDVTNDKRLETRFGVVDFETGVATVSVPKDVKSESFKITCTPKYPDIDTKNNNIVRISNVEVEIL